MSKLIHHKINKDVLLLCSVVLKGHAVLPFLFCRRCVCVGVVLHRNLRHSSFVMATWKQSRLGQANQWMTAWTTTHDDSNYESVSDVTHCNYPMLIIVFILQKQHSPSNILNKIKTFLMSPECYSSILVIKKIWDHGNKNSCRPMRMKRGQGNKNVFFSITDTQVHKCTCQNNGYQPIPLTLPVTPSWPIYTRGHLESRYMICTAYWYICLLLSG